MSSKRSFWTENYDGTFQQFFAGGLQLQQKTHEQAILTESMVSLSHPWPPPRRLRGIDLGGNWTCTTYEFHPRFAVGSWAYTHGLFQYKFSGFIMPVSLAPNRWPDPVVLSDNELNALGANGFRSTIPTRPLSQATQFLIELRDLPRLPLINAFKNKGRYFRNLARNIGSEYLNVEFGWKPYISDIQKATKATLNAKKRVKQFYQDSGKPVKRRTSPVKTQMVIGQAGPTASGGWPAQLSNLNPSNQKYSYVITQETTTWFTASYTYWLPKHGTDWLSNIIEGERKLAFLYGTRVTPETLWNVAPWTWLADYFGNFGDIVSNFSSFSQDNLVANYAYVMAEYKVTKSHFVSMFLGDGPQSVSTSMDCVTISKQRKQGSPYGFATSFSPTAKQAAIIGALGISRLPSRP